MSDYGIGIIGSGMIARFHAQAIGAMEGGVLRGFAGIEAASIAELASTFSVAAYPDVAAMLMVPVASGVGRSWLPPAPWACWIR